MDFYPHNLQLYVCPMEILQDKGDDGYVSCGNKKGSQEKPWLFILKNHWAVVEFHPKNQEKKSRKEMLRTVKQLVFLRSLQSTKMYLGGDNITTKVMYLLRVMRLYQKYHIFFLNKVLSPLLPNRVESQGRNLLAILCL